MKKSVIGGNNSQDVHLFSPGSNDENCINSQSKPIIIRIFPSISADCIEEKKGDHAIDDSKQKTTNLHASVNNIDDDPNAGGDIRLNLLAKTRNEKKQAAQYSITRLLSEFLNELEHNRKTISEFSGDKLLPLDTNTWDTNHQLIHYLIPNLKSHFTKLYDDISQINNLVWLSTEFNHISPSMCVQYKKLSMMTAMNLDTMIKRIKCFNQVERALSLISVY